MKAQPRLLGTVVELLDWDHKEVHGLIREAHFPEVAGTQVAMMVTWKDWSLMLASAKLGLRTNDVVEFTLPSALTGAPCGEALQGFACR